jgi:hypothetical protein
MKRHHTSATVLREPEKLPAFVLPGIARQSCQVPYFLGTSLPSGRPRPVLYTAFRNRVPAAVATPSLQANHGLCSSRAIEFLRPELPATSLFSCATSAPAGQSNSSERESPPETVTRKARILVFTRTQYAQKSPCLSCMLKPVLIKILC